MSATPNYIGHPRASAVIDVTTSPKALFTAGANGARVHAITAESADTSSRILVLSWGATRRSNDANQVHINTVTITGNAGQNATNLTVDLLDHAQGPWLDTSPGRFITLGPNETLFVNATTRPGRTIKALAMGADY